MPCSSMAMAKPATTDTAKVPKTKISVTLSCCQKVGSLSRSAY